MHRHLFICILFASGMALGVTQAQTAEQVARAAAFFAANLKMS